MVDQRKTNTIVMTGEDLLIAITDFLKKQDIEGNIEDLHSVVLNQSGLLDTDVSGTPVIDLSSTVVTVVLPLN